MSKLALNQGRQASLADAKSVGESKYNISWITSVGSLRTAEWGADLESSDDAVHGLSRNLTAL